MATERSDSVWEKWQANSLQFDYFLSGICVAVTAYLGKSITFGRIGCNPATLELVALILFAGSVVASFVRFERLLLFLAANHRLIYHGEMRGGLKAGAQAGAWLLNKASGQLLSSIDALVVAEKHGEAAAEAHRVANEAAGRAQTWYKARQWFLYAGFFAFVLARLWSASA